MKTVYRTSDRAQQKSHMQLQFQIGTALLAAAKFPQNFIEIVFENLQMAQMTPYTQGDDVKCYPYDSPDFPSIAAPTVLKPRCVASLGQYGQLVLRVEFMNNLAAATTVKLAIDDLTLPNAANIGFDMIFRAYSVVGSVIT